MLPESPPKMCVSGLMGYLKGKNSLTIYEQFGEHKFKDTVGKNKTKIQDYTKHQLDKDKLGNLLCLPYSGSPFTGRKQRKMQMPVLRAR